MLTEAQSFDLDRPFALPPALAHHLVQGRHLFIAPTIPTWVVVDEPEAEAIERLSRGATLREAGLTIRSFGLGEGVARERLAGLVQLLLTENFVRDAEIDDQADYVRLQVHITNRCNLACPHCYVSSGRPFAEEVGPEVWIEVFRYLNTRFPRVHLSISGGEPLTVPWLDALLSFAKQECGFDTAILTNGLLWTPDRTRSLAPNLDYAAVSLDGASEPIHDAIRGRGTFRRTIEGIKAIHAAGLRIVLNVTMMRRNRDDLIANLYPLVASLPFDVDVDIGKFIVEGRGEAMPDEALSPHEFQTTLTQLVAPFLRETWRPLPVSRRLNCGYGSSFTIYANGDVSPCITPRFIRGNVTRDGVPPVLDAILGEASAAVVDRLPLCRTCDVRYICGGRCHLNQLIPLGQMMQNDCPREYRDSFYHGLVKRFDAASAARADSPAAERR